MFTLPQPVSRKRALQGVFTLEHTCLTGAPTAATRVAAHLRNFREQTVKWGPSIDDYTLSSY